MPRTGTAIILVVLALALATASLSAGQSSPAPQKPETQKSEESRAATLALSGAQDAVDRKDYATATTILENFLFDHPGDVQALLLLAYTYAVQGRTRDAVDLYRQTLEVDPNQTAARMNLGRLLLQDEKPAEALAEFEKVVAAQPDNYDAQLYCAATLDHLGRDDEALDHYRRAAALDPKAVDPRQSILVILLAHEKWVEARAAADELQALQPDNSQLLLLQAQLLNHDGQKKEALVAFEKYLVAAAKDPAVPPDTLADIHLRVGRLARELGDADSALTHFRAARQTADDTQKQSALKEEAETLAWRERYAEAAPLFEQALARAPNDPDLLAGLGFVYLQTQQYDKAAPRLAQALAADPKRVEVYNHLISALFAGNHIAAALDFLDRRAQYAAETPGTLFLRGLAHDKLNQCAAAIEFYQKFLDTKPGTNSDQYFQATARLRFLKKTCREKRRE